MEENKKKKISIIITSILLVMLLIISASYAYFSSRGESSEKEVQAGTLRIVYTDNTEGTVEIDNIIPIYDNEIKTKANKFAFNIDNTGTSQAYVDIKLTDIVMDPELANLEFKWALYSGDEKISNGNFRNVANNEVLLTKNIELPQSNNKDYELYIWISENDLDQSTLMNKSFSCKITVEGNQEKGAELLSTVIKNNNPVQTGTPDFSKVAVSQEYYDTLLETKPHGSGTYPVSKENSTVENGLYKSMDDDGETYYFRGNIKNNYVKIGNLKWDNTRYMNFDTLERANEECDNNYVTYDYLSPEECKEELLERGHAIGEDMLWRIVRVNGDGTIRLVADGAISEPIGINTNSDNEKYVGYTYDNSNPNAGDGTSSEIKKKLENWYIVNLSNYDNLIANTRYCNDSSIAERNNNNILYEPGKRLKNNMSPTYICPNTNQTYGGEYDLKIGLLTADEVVFAGGKIYSRNNNYYLNNMDYYWLLSPYCVGDYCPNSEHAHLFDVYNDGSLNYHISSIKRRVVPVINLRADILYEVGDGTIDNPYIVNIR